MQSKEIQALLSQSFLPFRGKIVETCIFKHKTLSDYIMDIIHAMLLEEHSRRQCNAIIDFVENHPAAFNHLLRYMCGDDAVLSQRAAWPMSDIGIRNPSLVYAHWQTFQEEWIRPNRHPAIRRNITRILEHIDIPENAAGAVMHHSFLMLEDPQEAVAVKAGCITILQKFSQLYPEIIPEFTLLLQSLNNTPAIRARQKRALKALKKQS